MASYSMPQWMRWPSRATRLAPLAAPPKRPMRFRPPAAPPKSATSVTLASMPESRSTTIPLPWSKREVGPVCRFATSRPNRALLPKVTLISQARVRHPILAALNDRAILIREANGPAPDTSQCMTHYQPLDRLSKVGIDGSSTTMQGCPLAGSRKAISRRPGPTTFAERLRQFWSGAGRTRTSSIRIGFGGISGRWWCRSSCSGQLTGLRGSSGSLLDDLVD